MKRRDLISHLTAHGCVLDREGGNHSFWWNPATNRKAAVPRHTEVNNNTAKQLCREFGIPPPTKK